MPFMSIAPRTVAELRRWIRMLARRYDWQDRELPLQRWDDDGGAAPGGER